MNIKYCLNSLFWESVFTRSNFCTVNWCRMEFVPFVSIDNSCVRVVDYVSFPPFRSFLFLANVVLRFIQPLQWICRDSRLVGLNGMVITVIRALDMNLSNLILASACSGEPDQLRRRRLTGEHLHLVIHDKFLHNNINFWSYVKLSLIKNSQFFNLETLAWIENVTSPICILIVAFICT